MTDVKFNVAEIFTVEVLSTYPGFGRHGFEAIQGYKTLDAVRFLDARAPAKPPKEHIPHHMGYWEAFKVEFKIFLCTKDKKYSSLRKRVKKLGTAGQVAAVTAISEAIGSHIGTAGIVIGTLMVLSLITVINIGQEAYCKTVDVDSLAAVPRDQPPH